VSSKTTWLIAKSGAISPPSGRLLGSAYLVTLTRGSTTRTVVVEFADSSAVVSNGYAEEVARRFLRDEEPPQRVVVEASGGIDIVVGPRELANGEAPACPAEKTPQRARQHRR